jgi:hypothetical protein
MLVACGSPDERPESAAADAAKDATVPVFPVRQGPTALALIIAIADYGAPPTGMKNERGQDVLAYRALNAANDVPYMRGALEQHGFPSENIRELRDAAATRDGILNALEGLVAAAGEGDIVVIHYSGHGHQVTDDDGPADELDGYDEVLVPYGAPAEFVPGYTGDYHIRDDTVGYYVQRLRAKVGLTGNVTLFLDACYSGTATRGADDQLPVRGGLPPIGAPHAGARARTRSGGGAAQGIGFQVASTGDASRLAPFAVLSAARHDEVAREVYAPDGTTVMGSLTYALAQALPRLRPGDTYATLFTYITSALNGRVRQTPQMEGDRQAVVFGSTFVRDQAPSVRVAQILDARHVELDHGGLVGLNTASVVAFFPPSGHLDSTPAWVRGTVVQASATRAVVELATAPVAGINLLEARVLAERLAYGEQVVRVAIAPGVPAAVADSIRQRLAGTGMVLLVRHNQAPEVFIEAQPMAVADERALAPRGASAALVARRVEDWARNQYLRRLSLERPEIRVNFALAVVQHLGGDRCTSPNWATAANHAGHNGGGLWTLPPETDYVLRVHNQSDVPLYFAVLDLMPPGDTVTLVKALYPELEHSADAAVLPPGQSLQIPETCFYTEPTDGSETLKLIVSTDPIPVEQLIGMRTRSSARRTDVPMTATRELQLRVTQPLVP